MKTRIALLFLFASNLLNAQTTVIDSLKRELQSHTDDDTVKVSLLNTLSYSAWGEDPLKGLAYAQQALRLAQELQYSKGVGDAYKEISRYYWSQTEYDKSMSFALKALKEYEQCYDSMGISWCYGIIGINYSQANNFEQAVDYHNRALALNRKIKHKKGIARDLNNLGYAYELEKDYERALKYYKEALDMRVELRDQPGIALSYSNVGSIYLYIGNYPLAMDYLLQSLAIAEQLHNKNYIALALQNIGEVHYKTGNYKDGERNLQHALQVANEIGDKKRKEGVYEALKNLEESRHNYLASLRYLEQLQAIRDTLYTQERSKQMAEMSARYETEKKEQTIKLLEQEQKIHTIWRYVLIGGIVLVALASFIIYRLQRSRTRKTKELLDVQQALNDKLKEVDKLKSRFFANVSHEFRTPLTLLLAPIEEKLKKKVPYEEKENLLMMRRNANRLLDLVNQLLDLSKIEAGKMELRVAQGNLNQFVNILASSFDSLAENRKIRFEKDINLPDNEYWYDADVLEKIFNNLLSNALKFTPANGSVSIEICETNIAGQNNIIKIQVSDTGKGIPREDQEEIFSPFYQVKSMEDGQIGTGLGLSLVRELIHLYGGTINLVSEENKGTSITVLIPFDRKNFGPEQLIEGRTTNNHTPVHLTVHSDVPDIIEDQELDELKDIVLVVEDNTDLRNFMVSVLQKKYGVVTAVNGKEGMEQAVQHMPSLIVSDVMMPVMDGLALTEKVKSDEQTSHIPVILLTAKNEIDSRLEGLKTGADDYLTKPFSTAELLVRISNLVEQRKRLAAKYRNKIMVLPTASGGVSMEEKFLQRAKAIVEENMGNFLFGVDILAEEINLSRTQLLRKIKALTGLSPNEFIKDLRMKKAAELILSKADTITQISYTVGYADQSYFTKCFKKQYGVSPSEYAASGKGLVNL